VSRITSIGRGFRETIFQTRRSLIRENERAHPSHGQPLNTQDERELHDANFAMRLSLIVGLAMLIGKPRSIS
jgi:hypothetical protein